MKHCVGLLTLTILTLIAPDFTVRAYEVLPEIYDGSMKVYDLGIDEPLSAAMPDSLKPVFVDYLARHGARFLSSESKVNKIRSTLIAARESGYLTKSGFEFIALLDSVENSTDGRWGALDEIGHREERVLANQMLGIFPDLFSKGKIWAESTYVPRVERSMYDFCAQIGENKVNLEIYTSAGKQNNAQLRFFDVDKSYEDYLKDGAWKIEYDNTSSRRVPICPAFRLVGKMPDMDEVKLKDLTMQMYGVLQSLRAAGLPAPSTEWMSEDEYEACWEMSNLKHYLQRTPNVVSDIPARGAIPLLMSFISYGDSVASGHIGDLGAMLRFGHAETLMPLFALMKLPRCFTMNKHLKRVSDQWKDYEIVPLAANLIVAYSRGPSGTLYVAMRLNGKWVSPLGDDRMYVTWGELRDHWLQNIRYFTQPR